jgi:hypothetical protein
LTNSILADKIRAHFLKKTEMTDQAKAPDFIHRLREGFDALTVEKDRSKQSFRAQLVGLLFDVKNLEDGVLPGAEDHAEEIKLIKKGLGDVLKEMPEEVRKEIDQLLADPVIPPTDPNGPKLACYLPRGERLAKNGKNSK